LTGKVVVANRQQVVYIAAEKGIASDVSAGWSSIHGYAARRQRLPVVEGKTIALSAC